MKVRKPAQAGAFYAASPSELKAQIEGCFLHKNGPGQLPRVASPGQRELVALVCPHAGYMYSGPVAAHSYGGLAADGKPDSIIIFGPNHTGLGSAVSIYPDGKWVTPLGELVIDSGLAAEIRGKSKIIDVEEDAHLYEHSIEVQLPFLQFLYGSAVKFVPICMMLQDLVTSVELGDAAAKAVKGKNVLIIASTDMTHYEPHDTASKKDSLAIDAILKLDEAKLQEVVEAESISMCGYGPVTAAIRCAKNLGATTAKQLSYKTSGDATGDYSSVVAYLSVAIT